MKSLDEVLIVFVCQDSVFKMSKNHYPQVFLEKCEYVGKEKKVSKFIIKELEISCDESDYSDESDEKDWDAQRLNNESINLCDSTCIQKNLTFYNATNENKIQCFNCWR